MKINSIQTDNKQSNFGHLRISNKNVARLADLFESNPELQDRFVKKIVVPLKNCNIDVIVEGGTTSFRRLNEKFYNSIVSADKKKYIVNPRTKDYAWYNAPFCRSTQNPLEYTEEFLEETFLHKIEAGKNIALHLDTGKKDNIPNKALENWELSKESPLYPKYKELLDILG